MRVAARAAVLVVGTAVLLPRPAAPQSTTAPQPAPSMPPGETPTEAARDPNGTDDAAAGKLETARPTPRRDPPGDPVR